MVKSRLAARQKHILELVVSRYRSLYFWVGLHKVFEVRKRKTLHIRFEGSDELQVLPVGAEGPIPVLQKMQLSPEAIEQRINDGIDPRLNAFLSNSVFAFVAHTFH